MAYEKHTWDCGETITDIRMNNIEDGIEQAINGCGGLVVQIESNRTATAEECPRGGNVTTFNYTWQEVYDAVMAGRQIVWVRLNPSPHAMEAIYLQHVAFNTPESSGDPYYSVILDEDIFTAATADGALQMITCNEPQ